MIRLTAVLLLAGFGSVAGQVPAPVIDMHLHAMGANDQGPAPTPVCAPFATFPAWDQRTSYPATFMGEPPCDDPLWSPATDEELRDGTIAIIERHNVYGVLSGPTWRVAEWRQAAPGRFFAGLTFRAVPGAPSPDSLRVLVGAGHLEVLAEVTNQYAGMPPDADEMAPYWTLAEELDLPVGIHMGPGPPGAVYLADPTYRVSLGNPLLLEEVLARHPALRIYIMHAGYPFVDDLKALLYAYPQVHVEVGVVGFTRPRADFHAFLRSLVDGGFEDRIMFGSDQMNWPEAITRSIEAIEEAPFLSPSQKRAILYENAARFLRLPPEVRAAHHEGVTR